ncbi:MAG: hypothetical protein AVDCRST_MAG36-979 [uncultured Nocardioidaceae bacterium]|uniref:CHRD domain-containing protein n=1 Tax=uncultured Nocardioidaceae bacterium TaxID=253824 RepID=A0A6J4LLA3_9ACTN|nr:MAG: hypothetical protein AVDCRST_MAG36-979 [uncultured Nocardioidaceae bacterium]
MDKRSTVLAATALTAVAGAGIIATSLPGAAAPGSAGTGPVHLGAVLVGGNEVTAGDTDGYGLADVHVARREICWKITVSGVDTIAAAHIHAGPSKVSGPVVVPLVPVDKGCTEVPRRTARFIADHPSQWYVNVHNAEFPAGALRGQLRK